MHVIPVIDLQGGVVVHARRGERASYRPIESPLARDAAPLSVVGGLMALHPFRALYIADLDAIAGMGEHRAAIGAIGARFPALRLWLDAGFRDRATAQAWLAQERGDLVLASEVQEDARLLDLLRAQAPERVILSLDFRGEHLLGPATLREPARWPHRVIAMTLARVGSGEGPDLARVGELTAAAPDCSVHAAGGVRDAADLEGLRQAGAAGVLVATALHDGRIGPAELAAAERER